MVNNLQDVRALVPDQLAAYVSAMGDMHTEICGQCLLHHLDGIGVLVGYCPDAPEDMAPVNEALEKCLARRDIRHLTVLAPQRPDKAPAHAKTRCDWYWELPLPLTLANAKTRNMIRRASREVEIAAGDARAWTPQHAHLVDSFCQRKKNGLGEEDVFLFSRIPVYLARAPETVLFSAMDATGELAAFAVGDYNSLSTAFYMFAFRDVSAPPGTADLLLNALCKEGESRGHSRINLGLGINGGVEFFKSKWNARSWLPYAETSWSIPAKGWFSRLFGK